MKRGKPFNLGRLLSTLLVASIWILSVPAATWAACTCCACIEGGEVRCRVNDTDCGDCIVFEQGPAASCDACAMDPECMGGQTLCQGDPNMCLSGTEGACCVRGNCFILTPGGCSSAGGIYRGDDTLCTEPCKKPNGDGCSTGDECESTFCADEVCCNTACTEPGFICDAPEDRGRCVAGGVPPEPAPALAPWALSLTAALLGIIGIVAVRRHRTRSS